MKRGRTLWIAGELVQPFGRGMNLEIEVEDVEALHASCVGHGARIFLDMEEKWYRRDALLLGVPVYCSGPRRLSPAIVAILGNQCRIRRAEVWMIRE